LIQVRLGDVAIAVELEHYRTQDEAKEEDKAQHGSIKSPGGETGDRGPIDEHEQGKPARPEWYKPSIGKDKGAEQKAGVAKSISLLSYMPCINPAS